MRSNVFPRVEFESGVQIFRESSDLIQQFKFQIRIQCVELPGNRGVGLQDMKHFSCMNE